MSFFKGLFSMLVVRGLCTSGSILLGLVVAKFSGAEQLGRLALFISMLGVSGILARRGLDVVLIRAVAAASREMEPSISAFLLLNALKKALVGSILISIPVSIALREDVFGPGLKSSAAFIFFLLPGFSIVTIMAAYFKGSGLPVISPFFEIGGTSLFTALLIICAHFFGHTIDDGLILKAFSTVVLFFVLVSLPLIFSKFRIVKYQHVAPSGSEISAAGYFSGQWEFALVALSSFVMQAGSFLIIGAFFSSSDIGIIRIAERLAVIVSFPVLAINPYIAHKIVHLVNAKDINQLTSLLKKSIAASVALAAPPFLFLAFFAHATLSFLGPGFRSAEPYVVIMAATHFIFAVFGSFFMLLNMSNGHKEAMLISIGALCFALITYPIMARIFGVAGFVDAYAVLVVSKSVITARYAMARIRSETLG